MINQAPNIPCPRVLLKLRKQTQNLINTLFFFNIYFKCEKEKL